MCMRGRRTVALGKHNPLESGCKRDMSVWTDKHDRDAHDWEHHILYSALDHPLNLHCVPLCFGFLWPDENDAALQTVAPRCLKM